MAAFGCTESDVHPFQHTTTDFSILLKLIIKGAKGHIRRAISRRFLFCCHTSIMRGYPYSVRPPASLTIELGRYAAYQISLSDTLFGVDTLHYLNFNTCAYEKLRRVYQFIAVAVFTAWFCITNVGPRVTCGTSQLNDFITNLDRSFIMHTLSLEHILWKFPHSLSI